MDKEKHIQKKETEEETHPPHEGKITKKMRENPWILSTFVLGVLALILLIGNFGGMTGESISKGDAGNSLLTFANQQGANAELVGVEDIGDFYEVTLSFNGQEAPFMVTKDGEFLVQGLTPLNLVQTPTSQEQSADIPKSDKPEVELFIWSYCPYGVQAQGPLAEVASLLGDYADFEAILYHDGHGPYETYQNKIQECIQEISPSKYWNYAAGFVEEIYPVCGASRNIDCDKTESIALMKSLGIDSTKVMSCVDSKGDSLISASSSYAQQLGVTGSPTLVINGVKANVARTAEAYKSAVCNAFTDGTAPEECSTTLDSSAAAAAGNC